MIKQVFKTFVALAAMAAAATGPARAQYLEVNGDIETLSSNTTCTHLSVKNSAMLIVNQGVTLTLNCVNNDFDLSGYSDIELHGTMTGSAGSDTYWGKTATSSSISSTARSTRSPGWSARMETTSCTITATTPPPTATAR